jgi:hypothetical protein
MSASIDTLFQQKLKVSHAAHFINSSERQKIGIEAIEGHTPIAHVAERYGVSRKFVYQQKDKALKASVKPLKINPLLIIKFFFIFLLQSNGFFKWR